MAEAKSSDFDKVLSAWDVLVIAFGAMIGWGWVVSTGDWIMGGGILGAMLGFVIGGIMIFFVGLTYAELTSAMPQCGGEHVFSFKAMGPVGSFICTWAIVLGYVSVVCFEACALPTIITYIYPDFLQGYLYTIEGFDIYASWLAVAVLCSVIITYINIVGTKTAAMLQTILTVIIGGVGILLIAAAAVTGHASNLDNQLFMGATTGDMVKGTIAVAVMTPFYFIGFDVIPQAAEEISVSLKKIGRILILSIVLAVLFYALIIWGVGFVMNNAEIAQSMKGVGGLVTADAMAVAFGSSMMAKVLIIGGLCGIITSWNSFLIGGSRAMYSMANSYMIPCFFVKLHDKYKTPVNALLLIGLLSCIAPLFGKKMLVWVVDAGNFGCCVAYCMVAISFVILRSKEPNMPRPYRVSHYKIIGALAILMSGFMVVMYIIPGSGAALVPQEWAMVLIWSVLGALFGIYCKFKYGEKFATHIDVATEETTATTAEDLAFGRAMAAAMQDVQSETPVTYVVKPINFMFSMPVNMAFGTGKAAQTGDLIKPYGKKALIVTDSAISTTGDVLKTIIASLEKAGVAYSLFAHAGAAVSAVTTDAGADKARQEGCDMVLAVGGNMVVDCAKSIAYALANGVKWMQQSASSIKEALPMVFVPTQFDAGEICSPSFTVVDGDNKIVPIQESHLLAKVVIVDPECMKSMTKKDIALSGFMSLCKNLSAYISVSSQPLSDALALYGLTLLKDNLAAVYDDTAERGAFEKVVLGGMIGNMVSYETGGLLEKTMRGLAAQLNKPYDLVVAAAYPVVIGSACKSDVFRYGKVGRLLGGYTAEDCSPRLVGLAQALQLDIRIADAGITSAEVTSIASQYIKKAAATADGITVEQRTSLKGALEI